MSEETTETTTETDTAETTTATTEAPQSFIGSDGTFKEGWKTAYLTEDQRANARVTGGRVTSVQNLLDTVINSDKMISGDKMLKPSESSGDEEWNAYYSAGGWTGEAIPIVAPEGMEGYWSEDRAGKFAGLFNDLKLNPKQQAGLLEAYNGDYAEQMTNIANGAETSMADLKAGLLSEWGNAYAQKEHLANAAVEKGTKGDLDFKARILQKFGNDPDFIKYNANIGGDFSESGSIPTVAVDPTPSDIQSKINEIMASDAWAKPMHPEHKATMARLRQLHIEKTKIRVPA
jgi:hypothetical protein